MSATRPFNLKAGHVASVRLCLERAAILINRLFVP